VVPVEPQGTVHGNNERVPVESIEKGVRHLLEILEILAH
jgi:acetylornithine deacetylase/succinyl-diaminopimelate desuccinylase-like protein